MVAQRQQPLCGGGSGIRASWEGSVTAIGETVVSSECILLLVFLQWARDFILVIVQLTPFRTDEANSVQLAAVR